MFFSEATTSSCSSSGVSSSSSCNFDNNNYDFQQQQQQQHEPLVVLHHKLEKFPAKKKSLDFNCVLNDERVLNNLLFMEDNYCIQSNYFLYVQTEIKPWMRTILANWMLEVCENQKCDDDVFVLAMNILDRFLCVQSISKRHLQLLGTVCMFIASKLRSATPLSADTLVIYTDRSIVIEELLSWEQLVLHKLHWDIFSITANDFLPHLLQKLSIRQESVFKQHLTSFIALCSTDFRFSVLTPSMIASGCILNAINLLTNNNSKHFNETLMKQLSDLTFIEIDCLKECKEQIEELIEANYQLHPEIVDTIKANKYEISCQVPIVTESTINVN